MAIPVPYIIKPSQVPNHVLNTIEIGTILARRKKSQGNFFYSFGHSTLTQYHPDPSDHKRYQVSSRLSNCQTPTPTSEDMQRYPGPGRNIRKKLSTCAQGYPQPISIWKKGLVVHGAAQSVSAECTWGFWDRVWCTEKCKGSSESFLLPVQLLCSFL